MPLVARFASLETGAGALDGRSSPSLVRKPRRGASAEAVVEDSSITGCGCETLLQERDGAAKFPLRAEMGGHAHPSPSGVDIDPRFAVATPTAARTQISPIGPRSRNYSTTSLNTVITSALQ